MNRFHLEIITPTRSAYEDDVDGIVVPTAQGAMGVLAHHMPLFSTLTEGEIKINSREKELYLSIGGGFIEVVKTRVSILVSSAVHAHELNEAEIHKAQQSARDALSRKVKGAELLDAQAILRRSLMELKVLRRHRSGAPAIS